MTSGTPRYGWQPDTLAVNDNLRRDLESVDLSMLLNRLCESDSI